MSHARQVALVRLARGGLFALLGVVGLVVVFTFRGSDAVWTIVAATVVAVVLGGHHGHWVVTSLVRLHGTHAEAVEHVKADPFRHFAVYYEGPSPELGAVRKVFPANGLVCVWVRVDRDEAAREFLDRVSPGVVGPAVVTYDEVTPALDNATLVAAHRKYQARVSRKGRRLVGLDELDYIEVGQCIFDMANGDDDDSGSDSSTSATDSDLEYAIDTVTGLNDATSPSSADDDG